MEIPMIFVHATNESLARTLDVLDPFARNHFDDAEQAGWESDFEMARR